MVISKAVKEAVKREIDLGDFILSKYAKKLSHFENKYDMNTKKFLKKFESGKLGDDEEYFEWFALSKAKEHWQEKLKQLEAVQ